MVQQTTSKRLGKRARPLDDNVEGKDSANLQETNNDVDDDTVGPNSDDEDSSKVSSLYDDEQFDEIKTAIFELGCKKLLGKPWTDGDRLLLDQISNNPWHSILSISSKAISNVFLLCIPQVLLIGQACHDDVYLLKLSLSGIVNTLRSNDFDRVRPFLSVPNLDERLDIIVAKFRHDASASDTKDVVQQVVDAFVHGKSVEETMVLVHDLQRPLLLSKQRSSQAYRALDATLNILNFMGSYNDKDTEATVLRRFMTILTSIFSNNTSITLTEGETTSACTKSVQRLNVALLYKAGQGQSCGRKIDILVKHDQGSSKYIELSSIEVKPGSTGPALVRQQQNKNLRTNGANLAYLSSLNPNCPTLQTSAAIDFVGSAGYIYLLTNIDGIFYARQVGLIVLPKSRGTFTKLAETLDLLFAFEAFVCNLGHEAQAALEYRESLDNICEVANVRRESFPSPQHDIFITPTHHK